MLYESILCVSGTVLAIEGRSEKEDSQMNGLLCEESRAQAENVKYTGLIRLSIEPLGPSYCVHDQIAKSFNQMEILV